MLPVRDQVPCKFVYPNPEQTNARRINADPTINDLDKAEVFIITLSFFIFGLSLADPP